MGDKITRLEAANVIVSALSLESEVQERLKKKIFENSREGQRIGEFSDQFDRAGAARERQKEEKEVAEKLPVWTEEARISVASDKVLTKDSHEKLVQPLYDSFKRRFTAKDLGGMGAGEDLMNYLEGTEKNF